MDNISFMVLGHIIEGLTKIGANAQIQPAIAERWEISNEGATFYLRKDALWSDGKPVTAHDFVFAWQKVVDPLNASEYSAIMYPIKNAEAINTKKILNLSQLGVEALDDHTLKVHFEKPCAYFMALTAFTSFLPVRQDFYALKGERYGSDVKDLLFNGPFKLTKWQHGASLRLEKNEMYYDKSHVNLDVIDIPYILGDPMAIFNFFRDKKIDITNPTRPSADVYRLACRQGLQIKHGYGGAMVDLKFNTRKSRLTSNANLRKAIASVIDADEFVDKVIAIPATKVARGIVPSYMPGMKLRFRQEFRLPKPKPDIAKAKQYLEVAMKELNLKKPPTLTFLTDDTQSTAIDPYFQYVLHKTLGINLKIDKQTYKQRLAKAEAGEFDILYWLWFPDYLDPMTFIDLFASWNPNNKGRYFNPEVDNEIQKAQSTVDAKVRMEAMARAEQIALNEAATIPLYERLVLYLQSDRIDNVLVQPASFTPDFTQAFVKP